MKWGIDSVGARGCWLGVVLGCLVVWGLVIAAILVFWRL